jgi:sec-independent protein translocase protein TatC
MLRFFIKKLSDKSDDMTFWDHANVLRTHLLRSIIFLILAAGTAFFFKNIIFDEIILGPAHSDFITYRALCKLGNYFGTKSLCFEEIPLTLINIDIGGQFRWHMIISIVAGFLVSFPFIIWQLWLFVKPALKINETKKSRGIIFYISLLFTLGVLFGYYVVLPLSINFLANYELSSMIKNQITISSYISMSTMLPLSTGLVFELPVLVYFLANVGLLTAGFMKRNRKYSVIIILILAGIITPSTDILSQMLVAVPLYALYEISLIIAARVNKRQELEMNQ